ncbi:MAG: hypothetical protein Tsb0015_05520 [Simkaniaceae bacterium]
MNRIIVCLILPFIFFSCKESDSNNKPSHQIVHEFEKILKKENLELKNCSWNETTKQFSIYIFAPPYLAAVKDARETLYLLTRDFLYLVNTNKSFNPSSQIFTIDDLEVILDFKKYPPVFLQEAKLQKHQLKYFIKKLGKTNVTLETYEEAKEIVEKMLNTPKLPELNTKLANQIRFKFGEKIKKVKNLHLAGIGGSWNDQRKCLSIDFFAYFLSNIDTARELLIFCIQEFLKELNTSQEMKEALGHEFTIQNIEIAIFFKEDNGFDPNKHIRVISLNNNSNKSTIIFETKFNYFGLDTIKEETYDEALKIANCNQI